MLWIVGGSRRMKTAPTSIDVLLRPTQSQSDEPSDLRGSLSPTSVYSTQQSQAVTHPIINRARRCLTSVIEHKPLSERRIPYCVQAQSFHCTQRPSTVHVAPRQRSYLPSHSEPVRTTFCRTGAERGETFKNGIDVVHTEYNRIRTGKDGRDSSLERRTCLKCEPALPVQNRTGYKVVGPYFERDYRTGNGIAVL